MIHSHASDDSDMQGRAGAIILTPPRPTTRIEDQLLASKNITLAASEKPVADSPQKIVVGRRQAPPLFR